MNPDEKYSDKKLHSLIRTALGLGNWETVSPKMSARTKRDRMLAKIKAAIQQEDTKDV